MDDLDTRLRDRLFLTRIGRHLARTRVERETDVGRRLQKELHEVVAEALRLRRRARWLVRTQKPLPKTVR